MLQLSDLHAHSYCLRESAALSWACLPWATSKRREKQTFRAEQQPSKGRCADWSPPCLSHCCADFQAAACLLAEYASHCWLGCLSSCFTIACLCDTVRGGPLEGPEVKALAHVEDVEAVGVPHAKLLHAPAEQLHGVPSCPDRRLWVQGWQHLSHTQLKSRGKHCPQVPLPQTA